MSDLISRQAAIDAMKNMYQAAEKWGREASDDVIKARAESCMATLVETKLRIEELPAAQTESCEYYALCRHGRDENKLRVRLGICEYCNEDSDGYIKPIEKNGHAFVRFGANGWELRLKANWWHGSAKIRYCPMCGRDLLVK